MRYVAVLAGIGLLLAVTGTAEATKVSYWKDGNLEFSISNDQLATMGALAPANHPSFTFTTFEDRPGENNVQLNFTMGGADDGSWRDGQVGWAMEAGPGTLPGEYWDLSDYHSFELSFHNEGPLEPIWVNLFMNTGWTDPPNTWENDMYAQNGWTYLEVCDHTIVTLDLTNAERWQAGQELGWGPIGNLHEVTAIGFNIASKGPGDGQICVDTIPEPVTMAGLMLGIGCLARYARKRRKA